MKNFAINTAKEAGKIIMEYFHKDKDVKPKDKKHLVTVVDKKVETLITSKIKKEYPSHGFVGEEFGSENIKADYIWHIDPLDGTSNYIMGMPHFCVSLGLSYKSDTLLGVVYNPYTKEMFIAEKGKGAFMNGEKLKVSKVSKISESKIDTGFSLNEVLPNFFMLFKKLMTSFSKVRRYGSSALALCYVAAGRIDAFVWNGCTSWDITAGSLILEEAGGKVTDLEGNEWDPFMHSIAASNGKIHAQILKIAK